MTDREKVIKGLQEIVNSGWMWRKADYWALICKNALALLKAQEPRLLTLEEVKAFDWDYCYLEEERLPGIEYRAVCGDYAFTCITWPCVTSMRIQHGDESYGRKWRCWTSRPTDEQRRAVKWG